jgi:hypothetical protein
MNAAIGSKGILERLTDTNAKVFCMLWCITFLLYLPAINSGCVGDFPYGLYSFHHKTIWQFINAEAGVHSTFQLVNIVAWAGFALFGTHAWLWHVMTISFHAADMMLLTIFLQLLLSDTGVKNGRLLALASAVLFTVAPHLSEPIVWIPAFHVTLSCILLFSILLTTRKYIMTANAGYAAGASLLFILSTFATEIFYLAPVFVFLLGIYYRQIINKGRRGPFLAIFLPFMAILFAHFLLLRMLFHASVSNIGNFHFRGIWYYAGMALQFLFHIVLLGRYYPDHWRQAGYLLCNNKIIIIVLYGLFALLSLLVLTHRRRIRAEFKAMALLGCFALLSVLLFTTLDFPTVLLLTYDRYTYPADGFIYSFIVVAASLIGYHTIRISLIALYAVVNIALTCKMNRLWYRSDRITVNLIHTFPDIGNITVLLLDLPDCLRGIPMVAAQPDGRFKLMANVLGSRNVSGQVYDVVSYNMSSVNDGAHVTVINDTTINVTLNQWGTWWLYAMMGATDYENESYKVKMVDEGHWYRLILKHPADRYLMLYQVGDQWKTVDPAIKNVDQY